MAQPFDKMFFMFDKFMNMGGPLFAPDKGSYVINCETRLEAPNNVSRRVNNTEISAEKLLSCLKERVQKLQVDFNAGKFNKFELTIKDEAGKKTTFTDLKVLNEFIKQLEAAEKAVKDKENLERKQRAEADKPVPAGAGQADNEAVQQAERERKAREEAERKAKIAREAKEQAERHIKEAERLAEELRKLEEAEKLVADIDPEEALLMEELRKLEEQNKKAEAALAAVIAAKDQDKNNKPKAR